MLSKTLNQIQIGGVLHNISVSQHVINPGTLNPGIPQQTHPGATFPNVQVTFLMI